MECQKCGTVCEFTPQGCSGAILNEAPRVLELSKYGVPKVQYCMQIGALKVDGWNWSTEGGGLKVVGWKWKSENGWLKVVDWKWWTESGGLRVEERRWWEEEGWGDDRCGIENEDPPTESGGKTTSQTGAKIPSNIHVCWFIFDWFLQVSVFFGEIWKGALQETKQGKLKEIKKGILRPF